MEKIGFICESCGGQLAVNASTQTAVCQFCGVTYDYSYFNRTDALEKADRFLADGEFNAARDAFTFLLKKDPHDPYALEKLMLLTHGLKDRSDLEHKECIDSITGDPKDSEQIPMQAGDDDREDLLRLHEKIVTALRCRDINSEVLEIREKIKSNDRQKDEIELGILHEYIEIRSRYGEKTGEDMHPREYWKKNLKIVIPLWIFFMLIHIPVLLTGYPGIFVLCEFVYSAAFLLPLIYVYFKQVSPALEHIAGYEKKKEALEGESKDLRTREKNLLSEYNYLSLKIKTS